MDNDKPVVDQIELANRRIDERAADAATQAAWDLLFAAYVQRVTDAGDAAKLADKAMDEREKRIAGRAK